MLNPPGEASSKLTETTPRAEAEMHAEMFWRCAVAASLMPLASLQALARHHDDLKPHLAADDAPEAERRRKLVVAILPRFSMVCTTPAEAAAAAERRNEIERIKVERERLQREEEQATAAKDTAPAASTADEGVLL